MWWDAKWNKHDGPINMVDWIRSTNVSGFDVLLSLLLITDQYAHPLLVTRVWFQALPPINQYLSFLLFFYFCRNNVMATSFIFYLELPEHRAQRPFKRWRTNLIHLSNKGSESCIFILGTTPWFCKTAERELAGSEGWVYYGKMVCYEIVEHSAK
jgi:hypothetical protein